MRMFYVLYFASYLSDFFSHQLMFVVGFCYNSREPKEGANLCLDLIVLLTLNKVEPHFFLRLLRTALDNIQSLFTNRNTAIKGTVRCSLLKRYCGIHVLNARFKLLS
jgi:hypothetical protein